MQKNENGEIEESRTSSKAEEDNDKVTELPEIPALQHLAKQRPKRPKKHASSRNVVKVNIIISNSALISDLRVKSNYSRH